MVIIPIVDIILLLPGIGKNPVKPDHQRNIGSDENTQCTDENRFSVLRSDPHPKHHTERDQAEFQHGNDLPVTGYDVTVRRLKQFFHTLFLLTFLAF